MIDLGLFLFIAGLLLLGIRRPFVWVLAYIYIDTLAPQDIAARYSGGVERRLFEHATIIDCGVTE